MSDNYGLKVGVGTSAISVTCRKDATVISRNRWRLSRAMRQDEGPLVFVFQADNVNGSKFSEATNIPRLVLNKDKHGHLPTFGLTRAVGVVLAGDALTVTMPPDAKLKPLLNRRRRAIASPPAEQTSEQTLGGLVSSLNDLKAEMGDELILTVTDDGRLRARVVREFG